MTEGVHNDDVDTKGTGENSSDGESGEGGSKHSGPWKKAEGSPQESEPEPAQPPPPPPQQTQPPPSTGGNAYRPPQQRNPQAQMERPMGRLRNKNIAPDINSEEYFPTLNAKQPVVNDTGVWGRRLVILVVMIKILDRLELNVEIIIFEEA